MSVILWTNFTHVRFLVSGPIESSQIPFFSEECLNASFMVGWKFKILIAIYILQAKQKILCYVLWRKLQILRNELKINEGKKQHKNCKPCGSQIIPSSKLIICVHTVIGADRYLCHPLSKEL